MELSQVTKARAKTLGWSDALLARLEASAATEKQVDNLIGGRMPEPRVDGWLDFLERDPESPFAKAELRTLVTRAERVRATPGPDGLRLKDIEIGSYGEAPEVWKLRNDTPRGTQPTPGMHIPAGYAIYDKAEVWADGVADLYEDAIRDRWAPATELDWDSLTALPEDVERALDQVATVYSNNGLIEQKIIAKWLEEISYGYHEVKLFLATQCFDAGRKVEVLRKRALANGGGLGQAPLGELYRGLYASLTYSELMLLLNVIYKSYEVTLFGMLSEDGPSDFDRTLFGKLAQDSRRHLTYGLNHLEWYGRYADRAEEHIRIFFGRGEAAWALEMAQTHVEREPLAVLLGGGTESLAAGVDKLRQLRQKQLQDYLANLASIGIDRVGRTNPILGLATQDPLLASLSAPKG